MNSIGCCYRKVVDKRIYSIAMHPRNDLLLIAAGSTSGTIGLWKLDQVWMVPQYNRWPKTFRLANFDLSHSNFLTQAKFSVVEKMIVVVVGLPLLFLGMEVWREQQSRFTPST